MEMGAEYVERPHLVVYYRAVDETMGLNMEERRDNEDLKLIYQLCCTKTPLAGLPGGPRGFAFCFGGWENTLSVESKSGEKDLRD